MDKKKRGAGDPGGDTSKDAGQEARCGEDMKQAMAEMIESCGCCEEMRGMFVGKRRARRTSDSPSAKA